MEWPVEMASDMPNVVALNATKTKDHSMKRIAIVGLEMTNLAFQLHCIEDNGKPLTLWAFRRKLVDPG